MISADLKRRRGRLKLGGAGAHFPWERATLIPRIPRRRLGIPSPSPREFWSGPPICLSGSQVWQGPLNTPQEQKWDSNWLFIHPAQASCAKMSKQSMGEARTCTMPGLDVDNQKLGYGLFPAGLSLL